MTQFITIFIYNRYQLLQLTLTMSRYKTKIKHFHLLRRQMVVLTTDHHRYQHLV